jgi:hypothetical protein
MFRTWLLAAGIGLLTIAPAAADPDSDGLRAFGLLGTWATDCSHPPGPVNVYVTYATNAEGPPVYRLSNGHLPDLEGPIDKVHIESPTRISLTLPGKDARFDVLMIKDGDTIRSWQSKSENSGEFLIKDGIVTRLNLLSPISTRCSPTH